MTVFGSPSSARICSARARTSGLAASPSISATSMGMGDAAACTGRPATSTPGPRGRTPGRWGAGPARGGAGGGGGGGGRGTRLVRPPVGLPPTAPVCRRLDGIVVEGPQAGVGEALVVALHLVGAEVDRTQSHAVEFEGLRG